MSLPTLQVTKGDTKVHILSTLGARTDDGVTKNPNPRDCYPALLCDHIEYPILRIRLLT